MKRRNLTYSIALTVLIIAFIIYITLYIIGMFKSPFQSVLAVRYTSEESFSATGYVVRNEEVLTSPYDLVEPVCSSGEKIANGETVARIYSDEEAYKRVQEIDELEARLEQIQKTIDTRTSTGDAPSLENEIYAGIMEISRISGRDNNYGFESAAENLKNMLLRKEYLYGSATGLSQTESRLENQIAALKAAGDSDYTEIRSDKAGTFSTAVDGYERYLSTSVLEGMTLEDYDALAGLAVSVPRGAFGKIISSIDWCFATAVDSAEVDGLHVGDKVGVLFTGNYDEQIAMSVKYLTEGTDGRTLITLQTSEELYAVTGLRSQTVEISFGAYEGIRIPKSALTISSDGARGVYCVDGIVATFKTVTIISQTGDYYIVEEDREDPFALRVGNDVIVTLKGIYEGKILE